jgi:hypothetical protein
MDCDINITRVIAKYRRRFAACRMAQRAFTLVFTHHRKGALAPDMVRLIGSMIWDTRYIKRW